MGKHRYKNTILNKKKVFQLKKRQKDISDFYHAILKFSKKSQT